MQQPNDFQQDVIDTAPPLLDVNPVAKEGKAGKSSQDMIGDGLLYEPIKTEYRGQDMSQPVQYTEPLEVEGYGFWEGTGENIRTGILGTLARKTQAVMLGDDITFENMNQQYVPDDEDIEHLYAEGIPVTAVSSIMDGARDKESFMRNVALIKDNLAVEQKTQDSGVLGYVGGMVGEMVSDPTSFIPFGGAAIKGGKGAMKLLNHGLTRQLVGNVSTAAASEAFLRNQITGKEADVSGAVVGAAAVTVGLYGIGRAVSRSQLNRLEASQTARNTNSTDPTVGVNPDGKPKFMDDGEGGQVEITESGHTFKAGAIPPKGSNDMFRPNFLTDIATKASQADSEAIRAMAAKLVRPSQGYKGSDFVGETPRADTLNRALTARVNNLLTDISEALDELTDRHIIMGGKLQDRAVASRRVYLKASNSPLAPNDLTDLEIKMADKLRGYMDEMEQLLDDPSLLSGVKSPSLLTKQGKGSYMFRNYKASKVNHFVQKYGMDEMVKAAKASFKNAYDTAPNKAELDEVIMKDYPKHDKMTPEIMDDYLNKVKGFLNGDAPSNLDFISDDAGKLLRDPDHLKSRIPMGSHGEAVLPDGTVFRIDDLLDHDIEAGLGAYARSLNGKIALHASTGLDEAGIVKSIGEMRRVATSKADHEAIEAIEEAIKAFSNKSRSTDAYGMGDVLADTFRDAAFTGANNMMPLGQAFEILGAGLVRPWVVAATGKYMAQAFGRTLKQIMNMTPAEARRTMGDSVAGMGVARRMNLSYADWAENQAARMGKKKEHLSVGENAALRARFASLKGAEKAPATWLLNKVTESMIRASNDAGLEELIRHANGRGDSDLLSDKFFKSNGIPDSVRDDVLDVLKGIDADNIDAVNMTDKRWMSVREVLFAFGDELLLKTETVGQQDFRAKGPLGRMLMQFKRFSVASAPAAVKTIKDAVELQRFDRMLAFIGSVMSAAVAYPAITMMKSLAMSDEKRAEYLEEELSGDKLLFGAMKRVPNLAYPSLVYDTVGGFFDAPYAGLSKTTYEDWGGSGDVRADSGTGFINKAVNHTLAMAPAARVVGNLGAGMTAAGNVAWDRFMDEDHIRTSQEDSFNRTMMRSFGGLLPNDPLVVKPLYRQMMEQFGVDIESY